MKEAIIKANDYIAYAAYGLVILIGFVLACIGREVESLVFMLVGALVCTVVSGAWFVLSNISDHAAKQTELMQQMLERDK